MRMDGSYTLTAVQRPKSALFLPLVQLMAFLVI